MIEGTPEAITDAPLPPAITDAQKEYNRNEALRVRLIQMRIGKEIELRVPRANIPADLILSTIGLLNRMLWQVVVRSISDGNSKEVLTDLGEMKKQLSVIRGRDNGTST